MVNTNTYTQGYTDALRDMGLTKEAGVWNRVMRSIPAGIPDVARKVRSVVSPSGSTAVNNFSNSSARSGFKYQMGRLGRGAGEMLIGKPRKFVNEVREGTALSRHGVLREGMHPKGFGSKALFYGLPAYSAGSIITDNKGHKAQRLAGTAAGTALGFGAWGPLGLAGSLAGDAAGRSMGNYLARKATNDTVMPEGYDE